MSTPKETWRPELLAGYVDGELSARDRLAVESYLAAHPEVRNEATAQKEYCRTGSIWQQIAAPEPSAAMWDQVALRIHAGLKPQTTPAPNYRATEEEPRVPAWRRAAASSLVIAAMLLLAVGVVSQKPDIVNYVINTEDLPVATASDVQIVSVQGDDSMLVVGVPPVAGPIEFVTAGDVVELAIDTGATADPRNDSKPIVDPKDPKKGIWILPGSDNKTLPTP